MRINELKESIGSETYDITFNEYGLSINIRTGKIYNGVSVQSSLYRLLDKVDNKKAI
jgi:hypothetical protein